MGWPKGVKRGPRQKVQVKEEVAPPEQTVEPGRRELHKAMPAPQVEVSLAGRAQLASMRSAPKRPSWKMKAGNSWEDGVVSMEDAPDVLKIPLDIYPEGIVFFWGTRSIRGQDTPQILNGSKKNGWQVVHDEDFQGSPFWEYARNRWSRDDGGFIVHEACILMATSVENWLAQENRQKRLAKEQLLIREQSITGGGMNATGAEHPSALAHNKIQRTVERIEIPKE